MERLRKIVHPRIAGPVDLQLILNPTININVKLQLVQKISDKIEECCRNQLYFDNLIFVFLKLLSITEPSFTPDNDVFRIRKLILQIIHKVCDSNEKMKNHIQNTMVTCLKIIEIDNEQCVIYCIFIFKRLLTTFQPKFDGCYKTEIIQFLKLIIDIYNNSSTSQQILNFQKSADFNILISTIRLTTTVTKNSTNLILIPMGKISFKVLKELANTLKLYYILFFNDQSFKKDIIEFFPILMKFFNLDIPLKTDYRDLLIDLKHAQVRLLSFFSILLQDNKNTIGLYCSTLPSRIISLLNCNMTSDVSSLRTELLSGFESVILSDYKCEFLPFMDKFLDESLITGKSWSLKHTLRPRTYIYIEHLISHLHSQLSLNFLVRVIHLHFTNLLDPTLQPEVQMNLCNMVMNILNYIVQRQNQLITNLNILETNKNPIIDLFYRTFQIFVIKLKQFQKFYLPKLDKSRVYEENNEESIKTILSENKIKKNYEFIYGYHSAQIPLYTLSDCERFIKIIIPSIRKLFQFIVKFEGDICLMNHYYNKTLKLFIKHSFLSLKVFNCHNQKEEMIKEILNTLSCINQIHFKICINGDRLVKLIYENNLEVVFDMGLKNIVLVPIFCCLLFEYILNNFHSENEENYINDMINKLQLNVKLNTNEEMANEYVYKIIEKVQCNLENAPNPVFYLEILKTMIILLESTSYEFEENITSILRCLLNDLILYFQSLPNNLVLTKVTLADLCLTECLFKVILHTEVLNLLSIITYSLQIAELTPQGISILEKCIDIVPNNFFNSNLDILNEVIKGLYHCLNSQSELISKSAISILGKFGGLNRSSIMKPYHLNMQNQFQQDSKTPQIFISFDEHSNKLLKIDISQGINTAVEILITNNDRFNRANCWNIIRGFLIVSMNYDYSDLIKELIFCSDWKSSALIFSNSELQHLETIDINNDTYKKALIGLMICCNDEYLKDDAIKYLNIYVQQIVHIALCYFNNYITKSNLKVNPYVLIDAIVIILANEKVGISNVGEFAINLIIKNLYDILGDSAVHFPFITYILKQSCNLCYDPSWISKRGGCSGLKILILNFLSKDAIIKQPSNWFIPYFETVFRAMMHLFTDFNKHLKFGVLEKARNNLYAILNWFHHLETINLSYIKIERNIFKQLIDFIIGSDDLVREESIKIVKFMAELRQRLVMDILKPFYEYIQLHIPGKRLFNKYTFKSQIGIMKGHIFFSLFSIPSEELDFSNKRHRYYFNILYTVCQGNDVHISNINMLKSLKSNQLLEFRQLAMHVLVNSLSYLTLDKQKKIFHVLLCTLQSPNENLQETAYTCLKNVINTKLYIDIAMVNKILCFYTIQFQNRTKITLLNIRCIMYLSKLFPTLPNEIHCAILLNTFRHLWKNLHYCQNKKSKYELQLILMNILETIYLLTKAQFFHVKEICEIILNEDIINIEICITFYTMLTKCLLKFPKECIILFFQEINMKNGVWSSFFNSIICNKKEEAVKNILISDPSYIENLLISSKNDQSSTIQYESIRIIYSLIKINEKWISDKNIICQLMSIWTNPQYKERYKNLTAIKSNEWSEPKMLLKIIIKYFKINIHEIYILFQILPALSYRFPIDINFFREFIENEIIKLYPIQWKQMMFFKFINVYQRKDVNGDIIGKILQYLILPSFSMYYKNGEKDKFLCKHGNPDENIIGIILSKIFTNIRVTLVGCDFDGIKVFLCQLICLLINDLLLFNENVCDLIYNAVITCTRIKCIMDINVKFHCYLILTYLMLSGNASKREKLNQEIYYELLKSNFSEAQPVINFSLNLIVSAVCDKNKEVNTLVVCIKKIMMTELQNVPTLHHICSFLIKYNALFYPYKQFLIRNILGSLFPMAKNNVPEFKKTAIELACMIIQWELKDSTENTLSLKRKIDDEQSEVLILNPLPQQLKSSETIDNCLNFLAMVGCQTHDEKETSGISKLAKRSATLFKTILSTEPIDTMKVKLKFGWIEKILDTFLKKESLVKQNSIVLGNTNASVMNVSTAFDILSFMINVLSQTLMLEAIKPLQEHLIKFLQLAFNKVHSSSLYSNEEISTSNKLTESQIKQYNDGTIKVITEILNTFPSNEGIENLHTNIKLIIAEGLKSNCPHKLDISLTLLKVSLIHFPNYMDNEIINTVGDIMFKFNENNTNFFVKVKCLEILNNHIETLPRISKQVFIEKVVMENLNKAIDLENNIPFEVQIKCFELIISYIKELSEATEGLILNTTFLKYIKTTTDERIMIMILNVINKWINICRDESVYFNCQVIKVLKYITLLNRFPKLSKYCYRMNIEIYKNWNYEECIEFGVNCKYPSIRYDFLKLYYSIWNSKGLFMKLYSLMSGNISYELEFSLAFYVQLLFIQISKNTNIHGDFSLLCMKHLSGNFPGFLNKKKLQPVQTIFTYDLCSSLAQLCFIDENLAKNIWVTIIPRIWDFFSDNHKDLLSMKAKQFLAKSKLKNNFMTAFYEAIILCKPNIYFEPHLMVHIGKTYNLWYKVIEQLEDICDYFKHYKKNEAFEGIIKMYSLLQEEDVLEELYQNIILSENTKKILAIEQHGNFEVASNMYIDTLNHKKSKIQIYQNNSYDVEEELLKIHLTKCLKELNNWNYLSDYGMIKEENASLNFEWKWKKSINFYNCNHLNWNFEQKQIVWPSELKWKYHFYSGMFNLLKSNSQFISITQEHINYANNELIDKWKLLPKHISNGHFKLMQATQLVSELQEALHHKEKLLNTSESVNVNLLIDKWNNRKPWIGDDYNIWNTINAWRQTYYTSIITQGENSNKDDIQLIQVQSILQLGKISLRHNMVKTCGHLINSISDFNLNNNTKLIELSTLYLKLKCVQNIKNYGRTLNHTKIFQSNNNFTNNNPLLWAIKGSFQYYLSQTDLAFEYFTMSFCDDKILKSRPDYITWQYIIDVNFKNQFTDSNNKKLNNFTIKVLKNAWIQWATLIENNINQSSIKDIKIVSSAMKCYIIALNLTSNKKKMLMAKILWLLTYENDSYILLRILEQSNINFPDLWLPQLLNIIVEKNEIAVKRFISKIDQLHPHKMYIILKRMYLTERINMAEKMTNLVTYNTRDDLKNINIMQMMNSLRRCDLSILQLDYFIEQIVSLGEIWDEELRRCLYECLNQSYDYAFKKKYLNVQVPRKILTLIKKMLISLIIQGRKTGQLSDYYEYFEVKFLADFNSVSTIKILILKLWKWIKYIESKSIYPTKIVHEKQYSTIHKVDWSVIQLPSDYCLNDSFKKVRIQNFSNHIYVKDKCGTVVKEVSIRGTDGLLYSYDILTGKNIESEERIFQLFHIANNYLLNYKETAQRFLKLSIPQTLTITSNLRIVETKTTNFSLLEIYHEMSKIDWIHKDIDYWFSLFNTCIINNISNPLLLSLLFTEKKFKTDKVIKDWVSFKHPLKSDYWTFRKTFIEHYSVLCFFEYAFNLTKLKPEMLHIDKNNGVPVISYYKFFLSEGNLVSNSETKPFRITPSIQTFITINRSQQMINNLTATGQCLNNSIEDILIVLKLLLKDEFKAYYNSLHNIKPLENDQIIEKVDKNLKYISMKFDDLNNQVSNKMILDLYNHASNKNILMHFSPIFRSWL